MINRRISDKTRQARLFSRIENTSVRQKYERLATLVADQSSLSNCIAKPIGLSLVPACTVYGTSICKPSSLY